MLKDNGYVKGTVIHMKQLLRVGCIMMLLGSLVLPVLPVYADGTESEERTITEEERKAFDLVKDFPVSSGTYLHEFHNLEPNVLNVLSIDLTDPYTKVGLSYPNQFNSLQTTTNQALNYSVEDQTAVGAINGAFYHIGNKEPIGLISEYNRLVNMGYFSDDNTKYVNEPIAFGVDRNGQAKIDYYDIDLSYTLNGERYGITSMNKERDKDQLILYNDLYNCLLYTSPSPRD